MNRIASIRIAIFSLCVALLPILSIAQIADKGFNIDSLIKERGAQSGIEKYRSTELIYQEFLKTERKSATQYALQMLEEAKELNDQELSIAAGLNLAHHYCLLTRFENCLSISDSLLKLPSLKEKDRAGINYYKLLALYNLGEYNEVINLSYDAIALCNNLADSILKSDIIIVLSGAYVDKGAYELAFDEGLKALDILALGNDTIRWGEALLHIGMLHMKRKDRPSARGYYFKAQALLENFDNTNAHNKMLRSIASYYFKTNNPDSALMYYAVVEKYDSIHNKVKDLAGDHMNISHVYFRQRDFNTGFTYLRKAQRAFQDLGLKENLIHVDESFAITHFRLKNYDSALHYANNLYRHARETGNGRKLESALYLMAGAYDMKGEYSKSLNTYKDHIHVKDSLDGLAVKEKIIELEKKFEKVQNEKIIQQLQHEKEIQKSRERMLIAILAGGTFAFLLILMFLIYKRKLDKKLRTQQKLVLVKEKELAETNLEKAKLKEEELNKNILYKSKQLSMHALHMMQKNTILQDIQGSIKEISRKVVSEDRSQLKSLNVQINQSLRADKDWDLFRMYFQDINSNFYEQLKQTSSDLTTHDHRLCALIKLNMNSKEMASVLNVAPNSIKSSRYRLKKKLGLNIEADLEEFIRSMN